MRRYVALIRKDPASDYGVEFPDFPGCISAGSTLDEALAMAEEALEGHVGVMRDYGDPVPEPRGLDAVLRDPDLTGAVAVLVPLRAKKGRAVPVRITLDEHLLSDIDQSARRAGMTRSGFLATAARERLTGFSRDLETPRDKSRIRQAKSRELSGSKRVYVGEMSLHNLPNRIRRVTPRDDKATNISTLLFSSSSRLGRGFVQYKKGSPSLVIESDDDGGQPLAASISASSWDELVNQCGEGGKSSFGKKMLAAIKRLGDAADVRKHPTRSRKRNSA